MLEDESGRIRLVGERISAARLVTGVIMGVLGMETPNGEIEVVDLCEAGMAPQARSEMEGSPDDMDVDGEFYILYFCLILTFCIDANNASSPSLSDEWIAMVSGLDIGAASPSDAQIQILVEYLTGEAGGPEDQVSASQISRLVIAGNSFAPLGGGEYDGEGKKPVNAQIVLCRCYTTDFGL
jgi:DNA polymerase delta subunit 2